MSKHVLILGAGLVSQPLIDYLFKNTDFNLTVADILEENAQNAINGNPRGQVATLDVKNADHLGQLIAGSDLVVSLLPYVLHPIVAKHCIAAGKPMVNASYVSDDMRALDEEAREKGLLFLCEMGLDPGIDHMSAMQIIHSIRDRGGKIIEFVSVCGGLPAPEANTNPFGYKFSWSPKGVLLAGKSSARYIENKEIKELSPAELFHSTRPMTIEGREFEAYPNRDSISYEDAYGFGNIELLLRGTLRYPGWHEFILAFEALNLLQDIAIEPGMTSFAEILADLNELDSENIRSQIARKLEMTESSTVIQALEWLGLFDQDIFDCKGSTVIDLLADIMSKKMAYADEERDMVALQHRFRASYDGYDEKITSTLVDYGIPGGASSMSRTVSLPLAIVVKLILEDKINLSGVHIPTDPTIYEPVLAELKTLGIEFKEYAVRVKS
ncbi:MAG: saccharopine dehydrogenase C-terminal domain-containing protein [Candidatus Marinimicrobia bacterium]|nr:saccharopine dehydrogenase C-terminal domain-containing protein [Candidatus Neomarinimicrobiota bacterium]